MLEEIKKELLKLNIHECDIEDVFEILDRHNNQPDYKSAFEKILDIQMDIDGTTFGECFDTQVQDIKDEYNLGGE